MVPDAPILMSGKLPASYIGVGFQDVDKDRMQALKLKEERGVEVTKVDEESPAAKAGLKAGDVILDYNGQRVESSETFIRFVRETPPNREVKLAISREGQSQTVTLTTAPRKKVMAFSGEPMRIEIPRIEISPMAVSTPDTPRAHMSWRSGMLGVDGEALEGGLAEFFGVKEGVLVRAVNKDSAAEKAGLRPGDVLVKIDNEKVSSARQISSIFRANRDKRNYTLTVVREKKEMTVPVTLDEAPPAGTSIRGKVTP
jgi:serine protease Do